MAKDNRPRELEPKIGSLTITNSSNIIILIMIIITSCYGSFVLSVRWSDEGLAIGEQTNPIEPNIMEYCNSMCAFVDWQARFGKTNGSYLVSTSCSFHWVTSWPFGRSARPLDGLEAKAARMACVLALEWQLRVG